MKIKYFNPPVNSLIIDYTKAHNSLKIYYNGNHTNSVSLLFSKSDNQLKVNYYNGMTNGLNLVYNGDNTNVLDVDHKLADNSLNLKYTDYEFQNSLDINFYNVDSDIFRNTLIIKYELLEISAIEANFKSISTFTIKLSSAILLENQSETNLNIKLSSTIREIKIETVSSLDIKFVKLKELLPIIENQIQTNFSLYFKSITDNEVIMILSPEFELLAILEEYKDFVWNRRWRKVDDYELSLNRKVKVSNYLQLDNYVAAKKGDVVRAGRIATRNLKKDVNGEFLTVSGKGLGEIFENRIAINDVNTGDGYDTFSGNAESAMRYYIDQNLINPTDTNRQVSRLLNGNNNNFGKQINYRARFQKISDILYEISKASGLGWDIVLDLETKNFIFEVLTAKIRKGVRLDPTYDSVQMINFKENKSSNENQILIAGQGSGADRMIRTVSRNEV